MFEDQVIEFHDFFLKIFNHTILLKVFTFSSSFLVSKAFQFSESSLLAS